MCRRVCSTIVTTIIIVPETRGQVARLLRLTVGRCSPKTWPKSGVAQSIIILRGKRRRHGVTSYLKTPTTYDGHVTEFSTEATSSSTLASSFPSHFERLFIRQRSRRDNKESQGPPSLREIEVNFLFFFARNCRDFQPSLTNSF